MLILSRRIGEIIRIGPDVVVTMLGVRRRDLFRSNALGRIGAGANRRTSTGNLDPA
jgi:sRNA-binding carbon storage regulator CsrA